MSQFCKNVKEQLDSFMLMNSICPIIEGFEFKLLEEESGYDSISFSLFCKNKNIFNESDTLILNISVSSFRDLIEFKFSKNIFLILFDSEIRKKMKYLTVKDYAYLTLKNSDEITSFIEYYVKEYVRLTRSAFKLD